MKKAIIAVLAIITVTASYISCEGKSNDTIRIGLERQFMGVGSISVNNDEIKINVDDGKTYTLDGGVLIPASGTYYDSEESFTAYDKARDFDENGIPVLTSDGWGFYYTTDTVQEETEESTDDTDSKDKKTKTSIADEYDEVKLGNTEILLTTAEGTVLLDCDKYITITSDDNVVSLGDSAYRGSIEVYTSGGTLNAVNELEVDEYLYGVVPAEIYSSWGVEALKAQAVAARTYAYYSMGKHNNYDLCDNTHCQMYKGYNIEDTATNNAVDATSGEMIYYDNSPICAVYFDCSGGHTVSAESAWGSDIPYLQGVVDKYEVEPRTWTREFTLKELTAAASSMGYDIGDVVNVSIGEKTDNILVESIIITGTKGNAEISGVDIKEFFAQDGENLWSRCFTLSSGNVPANNVYVSAIDKDKNNVELEIISVIDGSGTVTVLDNLNCVVKSASGEMVISGGNSTVEEAQDTIVVSGGGWGHGVGMSQRGACGLAQQGYTYKEILEYYYKGVTVK